MVGFNTVSITSHKNYHLGSWQKNYDSIYSRQRLHTLMNKLELYGEGVEVGVLKGVYSEYLLSNSLLSCLYSIDPWKTFSQYEYTDTNNLEQEIHDKNYEETKKKLSVFGSRSKLLKMTSEAALELFENESLDFVYIDANHNYESVSFDVRNWCEKIRIGGMVAAHDYIPDGTYYDVPKRGFVSVRDYEGATDNKLEFGVKGAVDEFVSENRYELNITREQFMASWFFIKTH